MIYSAAHAVVCEALDQTPDWEHYINTIDWSAGPDEVVTITVSHPGSESYFATSISDGGDLEGSYLGWCIDTDLTIQSGQPYDAVPVPAYIVDSGGSVVVNPDVMGLVNDWTGFDEVAWLINQNLVGNGYHYCDVQTAIWDLLGEARSGCSGRNDTRVAQLVTMAYENSMDFVPGCNQNVPVILVPVDKDGNFVNIAQITIAQITFVELQVPCRAELGDCETAWALPDVGGIPWNRGGGWGRYFEFEGCMP